MYDCIIVCIVFFFFKQKTAYEMRISDWSSDVCSSDLTTVYAPGGDALAWALFVPLLNLAEVTGLNKKQPFWRDAQSFTEMSRIIGTVEGEPEQIGRASCRERVCQYV